MEKAGPLGPRKLACTDDPEGISRKFHFGQSHSRFFRYLEGWLAQAANRLNPAISAPERMKKGRRVRRMAGGQK